MENALIIGLFLASIAYLGKQFSQHFNTKNTTCAKGCGGGCKVPSFEQIEKTTEA